MKRILFLLGLVFVSALVTAQSVLITPGAHSINDDGTNQDQLNVFGNGLLVGPKVKFTKEDPASNVRTMSCASIDISSALAGILRDPSGDADYIGGLSYNCSFGLNTFDPLFQAYHIDFESLDTEADGDTVYVLDFYSSEVLGAYSGNALPLSLIVNNNLIRIKFKTDNDANVGAGFVLKWKAILRDGVSSAVQKYIGRGLVYDVGSGALWAGLHKLSDFKARGTSSTALGYNTAASGSSSTALGYRTVASGNYSIALGYVNSASGSYSAALGSSTSASGTSSTALGSYTSASGNFSTAIGSSTSASGTSSTAMGYRTKASGSYSTAIGVMATTNGFQGALVLSDYVSDSGDSLKADVENRLLARFENGYTFFTDNNLSSVIKYGIMAHNKANSWSSISDSTKKENFIASNGERVLKSVSQMFIGTWNYKGDDSSKNRHWGVMAQEFHHHFGKDAYGTIGNDTTIATADFDGVSFAAIKALEERTKKLQSDLASEMRFSASLELTNRKQEETIEKLQEQLQNQIQKNTAYESELLSVRAESMSVRAESRTVQAETKALKNDFKELKEMLLKTVAVKED